MSLLGFLGIGGKKTSSTNTTNQTDARSVLDGSNGGVVGSTINYNIVGADALALQMLRVPPGGQIQPDNSKAMGNSTPWLQTAGQASGGQVQKIAIAAAVVVGLVLVMKKR